MRTTLDIDPLALALIRELAAHRGVSLGRVASDLILASTQSNTPPTTQRPTTITTRFVGGF